MEKENDRKNNVNLEMSNKNNKEVLKRVIIFSDAVFAFAITLLIVDIRLPTSTVKVNLGPVLMSLWPNYLAFLISFFVINLYWMAHIRLYANGFLLFG